MTDDQTGRMITAGLGSIVLVVLYKATSFEFMVAVALSAIFAYVVFPERRPL